MIATKSLQYLNELLIQEELISAVAAHYVNMVSTGQLKTMLSNIIKTSSKNHDDILNYIKSHV